MTTIHATCKGSRFMALGALIAGCGGGNVSPASSSPDASFALEAGEPVEEAGVADASEGFGPVGWPRVDGGYVFPDAGVVSASHFITHVVDVTYGPCAGFGQDSFPRIVEGPPVGAGSDRGSTDVLSLGNGGSIVVSFDPNAILDGPGPDFIVFENPFLFGNPLHPYAEPGAVSVSEDGVTWMAFPCHATNASGGPFFSCAGHNPVFSNPASGVSPFDLTQAGGEAFDLHDVGATHARYVKIVDQGGEPCAATGSHATTNGFDLDAVVILNPERP